MAAAPAPARTTQLPPGQRPRRIHPPNPQTLRGFYANGRDKVIALNKLEVTGIQQKLRLLLDASGLKIKPLKRRTVESTNEAARGIWSGLHAERPIL
ncbi:L51-S25-CI-B8 domain-containing protein [Mycena kentingensis (nom. inval.)]|nr:L51-S25-CI-B8 domain-containing protein [Mycena kentingensis (nom. inval.)]